MRNPHANIIETFIHLTFRYNSMVMTLAHIRSRDPVIMSHDPATISDSVWVWFQEPIFLMGLNCILKLSTHWPLLISAFWTQINTRMGFFVLCKQLTVLFDWWDWSESDGNWIQVEGMSRKAALHDKRSNQTEWMFDQVQWKVMDRWDWKGNGQVCTCIGFLMWRQSRGSDEY